MSSRTFANNRKGFNLPQFSLDHQRKLLIGLVLLLALVAFEIFNFDTTQFALQSLLGDVKFAGILWATILAIAFCSIDFAGLVRLFTPERTAGANKEGWYLMGAWLLGATMNAVMTWWAVSLTLLNNNFGNEVLSREELLRYVPVFVAVLVWLTRILFIGAFSIAGEQLFDGQSKSRSQKAHQQSKPTGAPVKSRSASASRLDSSAAPKTMRQAQPSSYVEQAPSPSANHQTSSSQEPVPATSQSSRVRQRPPMPNGGARRPSSRLQAQRVNQYSGT